MTKEISQITKDQMKDIVIQTIKKEDPKTTKQLINLLLQNYSMLPEQTNNMLIELENEDHLHFTKQENKPSCAIAYILSKHALWYWTSILLAIITTITVFFISGNEIPLIYLRYSLGTIFVMFLPGFTLVKALFPKKILFKTFLEKTEVIEGVSLSLGMSMAIIPIVGLISNFTPLGIRLTPITLSLLGLTVVFATVGILREVKQKLR